MHNPTPLSLWACCALFLTLPDLSAQRSAVFASLAGKAADESTAFDGKISGNKHDRRTHLFQFGFRPTLILSAVGEARRSWIDKKEQKKALVRAFKRLDAMAKRWRKRDLEVICLHTTLIDRSKKPRRGKRFPTLDLGRMVKPKNMSMVVDKWTTGFLWRKGSSTTCNDIATGNRKGEAGFLWMLMLEPGKFAAVGKDAYGPELAKAIGDIQMPALLSQHATSKVVAAIAEYRLDDAEALIGKLVDKRPADEIKALKDMLARAGGLYRQTLLDPLQEHGLLPEYAEGLEQAAQLHWRGSGPGALDLEMAKKLRAEERFGKLLAERASLREIQALQEKQEKAAWADYRKQQKGSGYNEALANACMRKHHAVTVAAYKKWLKAHPDSPYRREGALEYMDLVESMQD